MHQVAGHHGLVRAAAEADGHMAGRMARRRQKAHMVVESVLAAHELDLASMTGSTLSPKGGTGVLAWTSLQ